MRTWVSVVSLALTIASLVILVLIIKDSICEDMCFDMLDEES